MLRLALILTINLIMSLTLMSQTYDFVVIVNKENPINEVKIDEVSDIFLKKIKKWKGNNVIMPINLTSISKLREKFSKKIHSKSINQIKSYWQQSIFSGKGVPPIEFDSEEEVINYISKNKYAIGYISADNKSNIIKEIVIIDE